jgi:dihydrofolate reductase
VGQLFGSTQLVHTLMEHDFIDEYCFRVHPIVLRSGKRLFREVPDTIVLKPVSTQAFSSGIVILTDEPALTTAKASPVPAAPP